MPTKKLIDSEYPQVCAVIITINGKKHLEVCLPSLLKMNYPKNKYTIIVVDNASTNDTVQYVKENFPQVVLVQSTKNLGWPGATDLGIIWAKENKNPQYFFLFNDDTKIDSNYFIETVKFAQKNPQYGVFGSTVYNMGTKVIQMAGGGWFDKNSSVFELLGEQQLDVGQFKKPMEIDHVYEAACCVSRKVIDKIGLFDPYWFYTLEGPDFCTRAKRAGFKTIYIPSAKAEHSISSTTNKNKNNGGFGSIFFSKLRFKMAKNRLRFSIKHHPVDKILLYELKYAKNGIKRLNQFPNLTPFVAFAGGFGYSIGWNLVYLPQTLKHRYSSKEDYESYLKQFIKKN